MSFVWAYRRFLRFDLDDDRGQPVTAFEIRATARTRRVMADHALVFQSEPAGFTLYSRYDPEAVDTLIGPITDRIRLSFALVLRERGFFDRYHPDLAGAGRQILLQNLDAGGSIRTAGTLSLAATVEQDELVQAGPASGFPVTIDLSSGAPDRLRARDRFDNSQLLEHEFTAPPGPALRLSVDLATLPHPAARLTTPVASALDQIVYADNEIAASGASAILDLWWDSRQDTVPQPNGAAFTATFRNRTNP
jgi:hypothetical protein